MMLDTVIIGGGLAGGSAAISLAQWGQRVMLFEASTYPHHKVCGEFLSPECRVLFQELGLLERLQTFNPPLMERARITTPDGMSWESSLPGKAIGLSRYVLDEAMIQHARSLGVEVCEGTRVTDVKGSFEESFEVTVRAGTGEYTVQARTVIGAYGKRSNLDRVFGREFMERKQPFVGLKAHYYGPPIPGRVDLHIFRGGYCGLSEIEGGQVNVCLLVRDSVFRREGRGDIPTFIEWMAGQNRDLGAWMREARPVDGQWLSIAQIPFVPKSLIKDDVLMTGDAAQLIAPLAGDGMAMALRGGQMAAGQIADLLDRRTTAADVRRNYPAMWQREFGLRLRLGGFLQGLMFHPPLIAAGLRLARAFPSLGQFFVAHTRDSQRVSP